MTGKHRDSGGQKEVTRGVSQPAHISARERKELGGGMAHQHWAQGPQLPNTHTQGSAARAETLHSHEF